MELKDRVCRTLLGKNEFDPLKAAKAVLSVNFHRDGQLFIHRFQLLNDSSFSMEDKNYRAKALVDLIMSIECSLKSICVSTSPSNIDAGALYKKLKKKGHRHKSLYDMALTYSNEMGFILPPYPEEVLKDLESLGLVNARYSQEIWAIQIEGPFAPSQGLLSETIHSPEWRDLLVNLAVTFSKVAIESHNINIQPYAAVIENRGSYEIELEKLKVARKS
ncbi:hypothetical protein [Vibrio alginolyticus]|uniref:hypothetical protein n=1 Tax=Vibrio alginolyticus TaxID=663 RepID=UPI001C9CE170|nr:hypothetical protein [Vibrio alginolyticus]EHR0921385.1 hypothetical protein [Vibrio parahaemolyticus]MBY7698548.1 hypothetical protein [Vibrio alginolyticus]